MTLLDLKIALLNLFYIPFVGFIVYLGLEEETLLLFTVLLTIDLFTGIAKAIKLNIKVKSWRLANGIISKMILLLVPLSVAVAAKALHVDMQALVYVVIDALILSELYSIIANSYTVRTGKVAEEFDVLALILKQIRLALNGLLGDK